MDFYTFIKLHKRFSSRVETHGNKILSKGSNIRSNKKIVKLPVASVHFALNAKTENEYANLFFIEYMLIRLVQHTDQ